MISPKNKEGIPLIFSKGNGAKIYTNDLKEYIDFDNAKGSIMLGHNYSIINEALCKFLVEQKDVKTGYHPYIYDVSKKLTTECQCESIAFFKTGTSAVQAAVNAIKKHTSLPIILSAGYHGYDPMWSRIKQICIPNEYGIVDFYYNLQLLEEIIDKYKGKIAAAVISFDTLYFDETWFNVVKQVLFEANIYLIADEVKTGYRYKPGLLSTSLNFQPDIVVLSKGLANGYPLASVLGPKEILKELSEFCYTSFFDPISFCVSSHTLEILGDPKSQNGLKEITQYFVNEIRKLIDVLLLPIKIIHDGPLFQFLIYDKELEKRFYDISLENGLLFYIGDNQAPSISFSQKIANEAILKIENVLLKLKEEFSKIIISEENIDVFFDTAWTLIDGLPFTENLQHETIMIQLKRMLNS